MLTPNSQAILYVLWHKFCPVISRTISSGAGVCQVCGWSLGNSGVGRMSSASLILLSSWKKTLLSGWCAGYFSASPGCIIGLVTTSTKDQIHITVFMKHEVYFTYPFLLMSYCHGKAAQYNSKTTAVCWVLIAVEHEIAWYYLHISCSLSLILWPLVLLRCD